MITLFITVIPSILILFYFIKSDKFKEPKKIIIMTFLLGVMITVLLVIGSLHFKNI